MDSLLSFIGFSVARIASHLLDMRISSRLGQMLIMLSHLFVLDFSFLAFIYSNVY